MEILGRELPLTSAKTNPFIIMAKGAVSADFWIKVWIRIAEAREMSGINQSERMGYR